MRHVVQFSTGLGSAEVARRVVETHGVANVALLTADTMVEDADNWRFAREAHECIGMPAWTVLRDGRTPMQVGRDLRVVPNNRMAVCSRILKRELLRKWIDANCDPERTVIHLGFDWTEPRRWERAKGRWEPYQVDAVLMREPYVNKMQLEAQWRERGIEPPRLYAQGFGHANCGGACVRGGQVPWANLLRVNRPRYLEWEAEEETTRDLLGKDVAILRDRRGKKTRPLPLRVFRERIEEQPSIFDDAAVDVEDVGYCGCDGPDDKAATP